MKAELVAGSIVAFVIAGCAVVLAAGSTLAKPYLEVPAIEVLKKGQHSPSALNLFVELLTRLFR